MLLEGCIGLAEGIDEPGCLFNLSFGDFGLDWQNSNGMNFRLANDLTSIYSQLPVSQPVKTIGNSMPGERGVSSGPPRADRKGGASRILAGNDQNFSNQSGSGNGYCNI